MPIPGIRTDVGDPSDDATVSVSRSDDSRLAEALEEYADLAQRGEPPQRSAFLRRHASIADSLEPCLDALDLVEDLAHDLDPDSAAPSALAGGASATLGDFRLIRELGRGGMGVVYEAEQVTLGRRVALKVLPTAASLDARQLQRFQVEAQAAALLHHENIVPIFAIGRDRGAHYYAMQLIEGQTLTEVIRDLRAKAPLQSSSHTSSSRAHFRQLARLALQAAEALEHAHDLGVIHRDIKPSNLLLDPKGKLWVADFGLARLPHEEHDLTRTGDLVGTLRYMSPEQVRAERGGVTASTDLYSLGATLYELLTLRPPFEASDRHELLREILHDEPVWPRKLDSSIPRDLETIVLKAMEKQPSARYATALDLAQDLRRFLGDQPIQARRPGFLDRSVKWGRRHRTAVAAAMSTLIMTLSTTTLILWRANIQTEAALAEHRKALNVQRQGVEHALAALDQITRLRVPTPGVTVPDEESVRILRWAIFYYNYIPSLLGEEDMVREPVAKALRQRGYCRMVLKDAKGAEDFRSAVDLYERLAARNPERIWLRTGLIETLHEFSRLLVAETDRQESEARFQRAFEVAESLTGNPEAAKSCYSSALVGPFNELARDLLRRSSDPLSPARARRIAKQAADWSPEVAKHWSTLGLACWRDGDWPGAIDALTRAIELNQGEDVADLYLLAMARRAQNATESSTSPTR